MVIVRGVKMEYWAHFGFRSQNQHSLACEILVSLIEVLMNESVGEIYPKRGQQYVIRITTGT